MANYHDIKYNVDYAGKAGSLIPISTFTSDGSDATASFTSGIDSTYDEYWFIFNDIHGQTDDKDLTFQVSTNGGSSYGIAVTSTHHRTYQGEGDTPTGWGYETSGDLNQSTSFQQVLQDIGSDNDESGAGVLRLYNPSGTTFAKHFLMEGIRVWSQPGAAHQFIGGYFTTTSAINAVQFKMQSGEIQGGTIQLFGIH